MPAYEKPVCRNCGSDDVLVDAFASWDPVAQDWKVHDTYAKNGFCNACNGEARTTWIEIEKPDTTARTQSETFAAMRAAYAVLHA